MFFRMITDDVLAQSAYLIGCQRTREAIVIDPERDVDRYVEIAEANGLHLTAATETHIHADFLSGCRELAERHKTKVYLSDMGDADWKYTWPGKGACDCRLVKDGDVIRVGGIELRVWHTPGHTPEHVSFIVTDTASGAAEPMGVVSGDFVFVGDLGRPDLLESAAGQAGVKEAFARRLWESAKGFTALPDFLQVWPGHGAGSACGKALGAVPTSTVGYEKRFNSALAAVGDAERFIANMIEGQPEPPMYFARMKVENRDGPKVLGELPVPKRVHVGDVGEIDGTKSVVIDTRDWGSFRQAHLNGALFAPAGKMFHSAVGSYVRPEDDIVLIAEQSSVEPLVRDLVRIGLDRVGRYVTPDDFAAWAGGGERTAGGERMAGGERAPGGNPTASTSEISPAELAARLRDDGPFVLDVRRAAEHAGGAVPTAINIAHTRLPEGLDRLPKDKPIIVHCQSGVRSAMASAYLARAGYDVTNLAGGYAAWEKTHPCSKTNRLAPTPNPTPPAPPSGQTRGRTSTGI